MDFWGFEGTIELPGEDFGFFNTGAGGPVAAPAPAPGPAPVADPAADRAVTFGANGVPEEGPRLTAADRALHTEYDGLSTEYRRYLTSGDGATIPRWEDFKTNPGALTTWFGNNREAMLRNGAPIGDLERRTGDVVRRGDALKTVRGHIANPSTASGSDDAARRSSISSEADRVSSDILGAYSAPTGGGGGANAPSGPGGVAAVRGALRDGAGILGDAAVLGATARTASNIYGGGGGGSYGFNISDGMGNVSASAGPGGGFGGVGTAGFGGVGGFGGGMDLSNTGFGIGMQSGEARSKSRAMEALINQLLAAISMGNLDAITSALTMCNLKAKTTMTQAATHVVRAMQLYDRQMRTISDQMGAIAGQSTNNPNTGAQMGHLNSEMNQISMSRQAISNMLRDIMTMNEEMSNMEKSFYDVKSREASLYRWS